MPDNISSAEKLEKLRKQLRFFSQSTDDIQKHFEVANKAFKQFGEISDKFYPKTNQDKHQLLLPPTLPPHIPTK